MARRDEDKHATKKFLLPLTPEQRAALDVLAGELSASSYLRGLIDADARRQKKPWPADDLVVGKRGAGRRRK